MYIDCDNLTMSLLEKKFESSILYYKYLEIQTKPSLTFKSHLTKLKQNQTFCRNLPLPYLTVPNLTNPNLPAFGKQIWNIVWERIRSSDWEPLLRLQR